MMPRFYLPSSDFYGARAAGITSVLLRRPETPLKGRDWALAEKAAVGAVVVDTLADIPGVVARSLDEDGGGRCASRSASITT